MTPDEVLEAYWRMYLIRQFEERVSELYAQGQIPGFVHLCIGQEASAVGAMWGLRESDIITSTHRGHGHSLAKGLDPGAMLAELMGKQAGTCHGRGGSMHVADPAHGIYGANGIVAAGLPIAVGAAKAIAIRQGDDVVVAFFGDGAVAQGAFHESLNLAALWRLPVIFFCENNGYSEFSRVSEQHPVTLDKRADGYGVPFHRLIGSDVENVATTMSQVIADVREGRGPVLVEAMTHRFHGHYEGDQQKYRSEVELSQLGENDPIRFTRERLRALGVADAVVAAGEERVGVELSNAVQVALASPDPDPATLLDYVYAESTQPMLMDDPPNPDVGQELRYSRAIRQALDDALQADQRVFLAGIDVAAGNVFGLTRGLSEKWPGRLFDTPISESAIVGLGVGAAMAGLRPVIEIMYLDFVGVCLDQIMNQAAKLRFMTGGNVRIPLVIRTQCGSGRSSGSQHSQSLEVLLAHIPGLVVVMPATAADAYGLLLSAIEDENPVVFIENRMLYERAHPSPPANYRVPLGKARIARAGSDATVVAWSRTVEEALQAAATLAEEGIEVEVLDLRSIVPLDRDAILESLDKTGRLVIAHDAVVDFGAGAEIAALACREGFFFLDAPVIRVGAPFSPAPYSASLEREWQPNAQDIVVAVRQQVNM